MLNDSLSNIGTWIQLACWATSGLSESAYTTLDLKDSYKNYKFLYIYSSSYNNNKPEGSNSIPLTLPSFVFDSSTNPYAILCIYNLDGTREFSFYRHSVTSFNVMKLKSTVSGFIQVYGIK